MDQLIFLTDIPKDTIRIFPIPSKNARKLIHQYLDQMDSKIPHVGFKCPFFRTTDYLRFKECWECNKKVLLDEYHEGSMQNNFDECRSGICSNCGEIVTWEINVDGSDDIKYVTKNNVLLLGEYFKGFDKRGNQNQSLVDIDDVLWIFKKIESKFYDVPRPKDYLKKKQLSKYLINCLNVTSNVG